MTLETLYFIAQIVAALAIVASLVFVGLQVRTSNIQQRIALLNQRSEMTSRLNQLMVQDEGLCEVLIKGAESIRPLTPAEFLRFSTFNHEWILIARQLKHHKEAVGVDDENFEALVRPLKRLFRQKGMHEWWAIGKRVYPDSEVAYIEDLVGITTEPQITEAPDDA